MVDERKIGERLLREHEDLASAKRVFLVDSAGNSLEPVCIKGSDAVGDSPTEDPVFVSGRSRTGGTIQPIEITDDGDVITSLHGTEQTFGDNVTNTNHAPP